MYTYTWYQWLAFFYVYCFLGWIFESTYGFPGNRNGSSTAVSATSDAAALRFRRGDDALGVPADAGQPAARLYFRFYRRHGA